jgi:hypothetical protein
MSRFTLRERGNMIVPGKEAHYLAPAADNLFFPPAKDGYNYFEMPGYTPNEPYVCEVARAADAAMLAYARFVRQRMNIDDLKAILDRAGNPLIKPIGDCFVDNANTARGFFAGNDQHGLLAFRGTEADNATDKLTDLDAAMVPENGAHVHQGFKRYLDAVWPEVSQWVGDWREGHTDAPITITGHSLGAALASLAFTRFKDPNTSLITFGCPRVGNREYCKQIENAARNQKCGRVVDDLDIVTHVPPQLFYEQPGIGLLWLSDKHELIANPPHPPDDWLAVLKLLPRFVTTHWFENLPDPLPEPLADHSPVRYCQWIGQAAKV